MELAAIVALAAFDIGLSQDDARLFDIQQPRFQKMPQNERP